MVATSTSSKSGKMRRRSVSSAVESKQAMPAGRNSHDEPSGRRRVFPTCWGSWRNGVACLSLKQEAVVRFHPIPLTGPCERNHDGVFVGGVTERVRLLLAVLI